MTSQHKQPTSSDNNQLQIEQGKHQEAAFLVSERMQSRRMRRQESHLRDLTEQQFQLSASMTAMRREVAKEMEDIRTDFESKASLQLETLNNDISKKLKDTENSLDKKVLEARNKIIEPLAIFVGLFTFISVGFQIFTQVKEYILWMPILGAVLGGIIILSGLVIHASSVNADTKERRKYTVGVVITGFVIFCLAGVYYHQAVEVLRTADSKDCVSVIRETGDDTGSETYCKLQH